MTAAKRLLKNFLVALTYHTGLLQGYLRWKLRRQAVVLMYHRVLTREQSAQSFSSEAIVVSPENFRRQIRTLREHFNPLSAEEFATALRNGKLPPRSCLVTFDDGWEDNLVNALPILQEFSVPALLFVATDYLGSTRSFWQEALARRLFAAASVPKLSIDLFRELGNEQVFGLPPAQLKPAIRRIIDQVKALPQQQIDELLQRVDGLLQQWQIVISSDHPDRFLSWQQVRQLHDSGVVSIGSHCCSHTPLTKLTLEQVREELQRSQSLIGEQLGAAPQDMAYPNGNHSAAIAEVVQQQGYRMAFSTIRGHVTPQDHAFTLRRVNINEPVTATAGHFLSRLAGLF